MDFVASINHLLNFLAPAFFLALGLASWARIFRQNQLESPSFIKQIAINFIFGALILLAGLCMFSRDGKMLTYAALVVASACCQWVLSRAWR